MLVATLLKLFILNVLIFWSIFCYSQITWEADTTITSNGDTFIYPEITFQPLKSFVEYDKNGELIWEAKMISNDTVVEMRIDTTTGYKTYGYYNLDSHIDSIVEYCGAYHGHFVRHISFCPNGTLEFDLKSFRSYFYSYYCNGNIQMKADSTAHLFSPCGQTTYYSPDGTTWSKGELYIEPTMVSGIEVGWWDSYEKGLKVKSEYYEFGKITKTIDYR